MEARGMDILIPIGSFAALAGVVLLGYCILLAVRAKKTATSDADLKARLQKVVALNMGALGLSALGLIMVIVGMAL
jgi:hypothetical protein